MGGGTMMLAVDDIVFTGDTIDEMFDNGAVMVNGVSLTNFVGITGAASVANTSSVAVILSLEKRPLAAWVAVIVVLPTPTIVTVPPDVTVATAVLLLVYVNAPILSVIGGVITNVVLLYALSAIAKDPNLYCKAIPLEKRPSPPYRLYDTPPIVALVIFVNVLSATFRRYTNAP